MYILYLRNTTALLALSFVIEVLHHHMTATMLDGGNDTIKVIH